MELKVKYSSRFKKGLRLAVKRGLDISLLVEIVEKPKARIPLDAKHKDHPLSGNYKGHRECYIQPDWLLIYLVEDDILTLTLVDTGTHADLLKM